MEYKQTNEGGQRLETAIVQYREEVRLKKLVVKDLTTAINMTKKEMDGVQAKLGQKQDEKRAANARSQEDFGGFDEDGGVEEGVVIDEEELMLLREMKDLKRSYREDYEKLKQAKVAIADAQGNIDGMKQQIVLDFERWYAEEFETGADQSTVVTYQGGATMTAAAPEEMADEEADAYMRAKRHVDTLHRAKKLERMRPGGYK